MTQSVTIRRKYEKPTLRKGPRLSDIAAEPATSGPRVARCWVARAAFGEHDLRWQIFRAWLVDDAPAWFRKAYLRHGAAVGAWLEGRSAARALVRSAMMPVIRRKLLG